MEMANIRMQRTCHEFARASHLWMSSTLVDVFPSAALGTEVCPGGKSMRASTSSTDGNLQSKQPGRDSLHNNASFSYQ